MRPLGPSSNKRPTVYLYYYKEINSYFTTLLTKEFQDIFASKIHTESFWYLVPCHSTCSGTVVATVRSILQMTISNILRANEVNTYGYNNWANSVAETQVENYPNDTIHLLTKVIIENLPEDHYHPGRYMYHTIIIYLIPGSFQFFSRSYLTIPSSSFFRLNQQIKISK